MKKTFVVALALLAASSALALKVRPPIGGLPGGGVLDPGPGIACAEPPSAPAYVGVGGQGATHVSVGYTDTSACETSYEIQHRNADANGAWVSRGTQPALGSGNATFTDYGLLEDTYYCYRVLARNSYGARASTNQQCMKTRHTEANAKALHDVRLRVKVAPFSDAGTNSPVLVRLNAKPTSGWYPIRNEMWLDYGRDDFRTNDNWTFIVDKANLPSDPRQPPMLSDISLVSLDVAGSDALCVSEIELLVNGSRAYLGTFGTTLATARCGSQGSPITVTKAELRASPAWQAFAQTSAPFDVSDTGVAAGIEAMLGDRMHGTPVYWDDEPAMSGVGDGLWLGMQAHPETDEGFTLNVPLRVDVNNWFDPQVLIQMVMRFESDCSGPRTKVKVSTEYIWADVGFDWWADIVHTVATAGFYFLLEPAIDGYAEGEVDPMEMSFSIPLDGCYVVVYTGNGFWFEPA